MFRLSTYTSDDLLSIPGHLVSHRNVFWMLVSHDDRIYFAQGTVVVRVQYTGRKKLMECALVSWCNALFFLTQGNGTRCKFPKKIFVSIL